MADPKLILTLSIESWIAEQRRLLKLEKDAEVEQAIALLTKNSSEELESLGVTISRLTCVDVSFGLFGRTIIKASDDFGRPLPAHKFTSGDIVGIRLGNSGLPQLTSASKAVDRGQIPLREQYEHSGVVTAADDKSISIVLDDDRRRQDEDAGLISVGDRVSLDKIGDEVTHNRLIAVLDGLLPDKTSSSRDGVSYSGPADKILQILFPIGRVSTTSSPLPVPEFEAELPALVAPGTGTRGFTLPAPPQGLTLVHQGLNESQVSAIDAALRAKDVCMIHGPPGTGKTTTIVEYILQEVARGRRVLATAPSNVAVDNILERLATKSSKLRCVRLGHPARVSAALLQHSLDAQVERHEGTSIVADVRKDLMRVQSEMRKLGRRDKGKRGEMRQEERALKSEIRKREEKVVMETLRNADVVLTTVTGAATRILQRALQPDSESSASATEGGASAEPAWFDVVVVDEVAQAVEVATLIPALLGRKLVVAGDHQQLPPTVISEEAAAQGLSVTVADRLVALYDPQPRKRPAASATAAASASGVKSAVHIADTVLAKLPTPPPTALPVVHMLLVQYRMHEQISRWASEALYGGRLMPHPSVAQHILSDLPSVKTALSGAQVDPRTGAVSIRVKANDIDLVRGAAAESAKESRLAAVAAQRQGQEGGTEEKDKGRKGRNDKVQLMDSRTAAAVEAQAVKPASGSPGLKARDVWIDTESLVAPTLLVDTSGCDMPEATDEATGSTSNVREADVVVKHVLALLAAGVPDRDIAVVTPYNAQVSLLRAMLGPSRPAIEVRTVDGFQGQEKEAIVLSLVRSNEYRKVGFLSDYRRINVAVTRAKRHVAVITDADTTRADPFIKGLLTYLEENGEVRSAMEYDDTTVGSDSAVGGLSVSFDSGTGTGSRHEGQGSAARASNTQKKSEVQTGKTKKGKTQKQGDGGSKSANALLALVRKQLKSFVKACDDFPTEVSMVADGLASASKSKEGKELSKALQSLPMAALAASACESADIGIDLKRELATLGGARASLHAAAAEQGAQPVLHYPTACTALHRALVHKAATDLGLPHVSVGEGSSRCVTVRYIAAEARAVLRNSDGGAATGLTDSSQAHDLISPARPEESAEVWTRMLAGMTLDDDDEQLEHSRKDEGRSYGAASEEVQGLAAKLQEQSEQVAHRDEVAASVSVDPRPHGLVVSSATSKQQADKDRSAQESVAPGKANTLLAQLAAERAQRAPQPSSSIPASAALEPGLDLRPGAKQAKGVVDGATGSGGGGKKSKGAVSTGSHPPVDSDGVKREFGVPVAPLKPMGVLSGSASNQTQASSSAAAPAAQAATDAATGSKGTAKGKGKGKKGKVEESEEEDDEMAFLDAVIAQSKVCAVKGCNKSTQTTGSLCTHCHLRFCYGHGMPEIHGCGDAARASARKKWVDSGGNLVSLGSGGGGGGGGPPPAPLSAAKRSALANKLEKKLDAAASDRAPQIKKEEKKK